MKKVVVFGKPAGGKSTFSKKLSQITGIKIYHLDMIEYLKSGERVPTAEYESEHSKIIQSDSWIIEGFGSVESLKARIIEADTMIYIDMPYSFSYWWVTKRFLKSVFIKPEGWPKGCSVLKGTINGFKYLRLSKNFWTDAFVKKLENINKDNTKVRLRSKKEQNNFIKNHIQ